MFNPIRTPNEEDLLLILAAIATSLVGNCGFLTGCTVFSWFRFLVIHLVLVCPCI